MGISHNSRRAWQKENNHILLKNNENLSARVPRPLGGERTPMTPSCQFVAMNAMEKTAAGSSETAWFPSAFVDEFRPWIGPCPWPSFDMARDCGR
jgi:hypothetical protein